MTRRTALLSTMPQLLGAALAAASLASSGCASAPTTRFHTLLAPAAAVAQGAAGAPLVWELLPVTMPAQVDQPQLVVRAGDGTLDVLEHERWIAPLADEFRAAIADRLTQALGPPRSGLAGERAGQSWRVRVDVQRFDSVPGRYAREDVVWAIIPVAAGGARLTCRSSFEQPVDAGYPALAAGHREAVLRLADAIRADLTALEAGLPAHCPSG